MIFTHTLFLKASSCFFEADPWHPSDQVVLAPTAFTFYTSAVVTVHTMRQLMTVPLTAL